jgi:16S rRNA (cytosine1402-N4)-methyltransferase
MVEHVPVMTEEVVAFLAAERGGLFVDCTVGLGGHARALLEAGATRVLGLDRDGAALSRAAQALASWRDHVELVQADYRELTRVLDERGIDRIDGAVADLGVSSLQLDTEGRGFSFMRDEPLDMRFDQRAGPTAADLLRDVDATELADVIFKYGEERQSRRIARAIVEARRKSPIETTGQLANIVRRHVRRGADRLDPATRTFQAIRIWVNRELEGMSEFIRDVIYRLAHGARLVAIAFHSLEDRIVKQTLRALATSPDIAVRVLTRKPVRATRDETDRNPRARSAKLRAIERVA